MKMIVNNISTMNLYLTHHTGMHSCTMLFCKVLPRRLLH